MIVLHSSLVSCPSFPHRHINSAMEEAQEQAIQPDSVVEVVKSEEIKPSVLENPERSRGIFDGVHFCLCDDVRDIDEVSCLLDHIDSTK